MTATTGMIAGMYHMQIAFRSSAGYPMGTQITPNDVANGTTTHAYKVRGIVEVAAPSPTYSVANRRAGQTLLGQVQLGLSDLGSFTFTLSDYDETLRSYVNGIAPDTTTSTGTTLTASNVALATKPQFVAIFTTGFQTDAGTNMFLNIIYPSVQISDAYPGGSQGDGDNPNALTYTCTPTTRVNTGLGLTYAATNLDVQGDVDIQTVARTSAPLALTTYVAEGSATTFTLGYRPTTTSVDGTTNIWSLNGADGNTSVTALNATTGAVTISSATAAHVYVAAYQTNFVSI
jgi:hypothetical protein